MRAVRILTILFGVTLSATLLAAWLVPPMLDWNQYRGTLAALVSDAFGRAVRIEGPVTLSLLPQPILTAARITMADADDATITVPELRLRLALGPLLRGRVDAQELVLRGLDIRLPWPLDTSRLPLSAPSWLSSLQARIEGGRVSVGGVAVTGIDATLATLPDTGSLALAGTAQFSGQSWHMTARLTRPDGNGAAGLDLTMDGQGPMQGLGGMFSGQIGADGEVAGRVSGRGPDLSRLLPAPRVAFRADGRLSIAAGLALADQLSVDIAGSPARGTVALRLGASPRLDVSLAASRLDLDSWLAAMLIRSEAPGAPPIATGIDLSAEAASLSGGVLRALRGRFDITDSGISLQDGTAVLPGEARLTLSGAFRSPARSGQDRTAGLRFDGRATLEAPTLRTTLAWLDGAGFGLLGFVPPAVLRQASLRGLVAAELGPVTQVSLSELDGTLDGAAVKGALVARTGTRPALSGQLALGTLELDPWLPSDWPGLSGAAARFARLDLDLRLAAARLRLRGQDVSEAALEVTTAPGRITLRRLEGNTAGLHLALSGGVDEAGRITDGRFELRSPGLDQALADAARFGLPLPAGLPAPRWPVTLSVQAAGPPEALALRGVLDAGDLHAEAQPLIDLAAARLAGPLTLRHPGAPRLLEALGVTGAQSWLGDGSLSLVATLNATSSRLAADSFDLAAGLLRAGGALALERGAGGALALERAAGEAAMPRLTGRVHAETLPLPMPALRSADPLPLAALSGWQASVRLEAVTLLAGLSPLLDQASMTVTLQNGALRLESLSARIDGGALSGAVAFDSAAAPPRLTAELALAGAHLSGPLFDLPVDVSAGQLDGTVMLQASGFAPQALLATLSGKASLAVHDGVLVGADLTRAGPRLLEPDLRTVLSGGSFAFQQLGLNATLANGTIRLAGGSLAAPSGLGTITGLVDLTARTSELRLALRPAVQDPPEIAVRLSGAWASPVRTPELAEALVWRATHP